MINETAVKEALETSVEIIDNYSSLLSVLMKRPGFDTPNALTTFLGTISALQDKSNEIRNLLRTFSSKEEPTEIIKQTVNRHIDLSE